jgi:hypothetical protein
VCPNPKTYKSSCHAHSVIFCAVCPTWRRNTRAEPGHSRKGQGPNTRSLRKLHQQHHAHSTQPAACSSRSTRGWNGPGASVDALGCNLLLPTPLQGLIYAEDEWPFRNECLYEQSQQDAARFPTRLYSLPEDATIGVEPLILGSGPSCVRSELTTLLPGAESLL